MTILTRPLGLLLAQSSPDAPSASSTSIIDFINAGGIIGYIIILLSIVTVVLIVIHLIQIRESALAPPRIVDDLDALLSKGRADEAAEYCDEADNACFLTNVMAAGLARYRRSAFGALELRAALEEAGREQLARLNRSTDATALVAGIAPMLGLLGTVVGINGAFATISTAEGFARPDQLAGDISLALVTTIMGLTLAIPATAAVTFFRNRIDAISGDLAVTIDELAGHLEEELQAGSGQPPRS